MVSTLWHTGLIDKQQNMWRKLIIVQVFKETDNSNHMMSFQVCDFFFSVERNLTLKPHKKMGWFSYFNNSTILPLDPHMKLKNKRKMFYKIKKDNWYNNFSLKATWSSESENGVHDDDDEDDNDTAEK